MRFALSGALACVAMVEPVRKVHGATGRESRVAGLGLCDARGAVRWFYMGFRLICCTLRKDGRCSVASSSAPNALDVLSDPTHDETQVESNVISRVDG